MFQLEHGLSSIALYIDVVVLQVYLKLTFLGTFDPGANDPNFTLTLLVVIMSMPEGIGELPSHGKRKQCMSFRLEVGHVF